MRWASGVDYIKRTGRYRYFYDLYGVQGKRRRVYSQSEYESLEYALWARLQYKRYIRAMGLHHSSPPPIGTRTHRHSHF